jgi:predicted RNA binding protein YcfA (HicA-like mRNA interferase family)
MFKPASTKCWEKFLEMKGLKCVRISSSHHQWKKTGCRTIPVWGDEKQVPALHIRTGCKSLQCDPDEFYRWAENNC